MAAKKKSAAKAAPRADDPVRDLTPTQTLAALCEVETGAPAGKGRISREDVEAFVETLPEPAKLRAEDALHATHRNMGGLSAAYAVKAAIAGLVD